jgi:hypothetical protein
MSKESAGPSISVWDQLCRTLCLQSLMAIVVCQFKRIKGRFASALDPLELARN